MEQTLDKAREIARELPLPSVVVAVVGSWVWVEAPKNLTMALESLGLKYSRDKAKFYWRPAGRVRRARRPKPYNAITARYGEHVLGATSRD